MKRFDEQGLEDAVNRITDKWGRDIKVLMECRHDIMADFCGTCAGETLFGPVDEVRRFLETRKLLSIEIIDSSPKGAKKRVVPQGAVISASLIFGALAWEGGRIILRLLQKGKENRP